ncbi:17461_t:CDS:1, partial [Racocetra persica]
WNEEAQEKAKTELARQFKNITDSNYKQTTISIYTTSSGDSNICRNCLHSSIFGTSTSTYTAFNPLAKLECYLDPTQTSIANDN